MLTGILAVKVVKGPLEAKAVVKSNCLLALMALLIQCLDMFPVLLVLSFAKKVMTLNVPV